MKTTYIWSQAGDLGLLTKILPHHFWADDFRLNWKDKWEIVLKSHESKICSLYLNIFLTPILHRGFGNLDFPIQFLFGILFPFSIWAFLFLVYLDFYFSFLFGLLFPFSIWTFSSLFCLDFYFPFLLGLLFPFSIKNFISLFYFYFPLIFGLFIFLLYLFSPLTLVVFFLFSFYIPFFSISISDFGFLPNFKIQSYFLLILF